MTTPKPPFPGADPDRPMVVVPQMCQKHQALLLRQIGQGPNDPWRATIIMAQITLFQGVSARPATFTRIGGDLTRIGELGCLACHAPDLFGEVVDCFQKGESIKALGERWVAAGEKKGDTA